MSNTISFLGHQNNFSESALFHGIDYILGAFFYAFLIYGALLRKTKVDFFSNNHSQLNQNLQILNPKWTPGIYVYSSISRDVFEPKTY